MNLVLWASIGVIGVLLIAGVLFFILRQNSTDYEAISEEIAPNLKLFEITLPRQDVKEEGQKKNNLEEQLSPDEEVIRNLFTVKEFNENDYFSLEIALYEGEVRFYAAVPEDATTLFEKQVTGQYSDALVEEIDTYNIFPKKGRVVATELQLKNEEFYPLRTYKDMQVDPMEAIVNAFSKLGEDEGAAIQIMLKPKEDDWQKKGQDKARKMKQGEKDSSILEDVSSEFKDSLSDLATLSSNDDSEKPDSPERLTQEQEEIIESIEDKAAQHGFETIIRIISAGPDEPHARTNLNNMLSAFGQLDSPSRNGFKQLDDPDENEIISNFIFRYFVPQGETMTLTPSEIATFYHVPGSNIQASHVKRLKSRKLAPPNNLPDEGLLIGKSVYRGQEKEVRLQKKDRRRHFYEIGKTGTGKTTWMQNLAYQDIVNGEGVAVVDPHGEMADWLLSRIPEERADDVIYFDPEDTDRPLGLNLLEADTSNQKDLAASEMISIFTQMFDSEFIGPMFEHYMRNAMLALMADEEEGATLVEVPRMFVDDEFRKAKVKQVDNPTVKEFWTQEYEQSRKGQQAYDMLSYVISKLGRFISNDLMRNIIGQPESAFDLREVMDEGKILIANLSKGTIGDINSNLLGFILVSKIQMAALSRANVPESERPDFYLYIDEFQNVTTPSISTILSEARKYRLNLTIAHQFMDQLDEEIQNAVLGNVGSMMAFRIGASDAEVLEKEFEPEVSAHDLVNIGNWQAYLKLMIEGSTSPAFNIKTLPPMGEENTEMRDALKELSRTKYGRDKRLVDMDIKQRGAIVTELKQ